MKADDVVQKLLPSSPHVLENNYYLSDIEIENIGTLHALWPKSEINSELELLLFAIVIMSLMALFITGGLTFVVLSKFVLTPMGLVKDQLDNIGTNEFIIPELRSYKDEIGELAVGMQKASQALVEKNNALEMIAYHDELTGLANRHRFFDCLSSYMAYSDRHHAKLTLLFLDRDGFKEVNDTSGHEAGDHVLKEVAERLQRCVRDEDFVTPILGQDKADSLSRLGGDEFTVLLFGLKNNRDAGIVASRLIAVLNEAFTVDEQIFHLGASIGIAHYPDDGNDTSSLLKNADTAMYASKEHGKNMYSYYKASMSEVALLKHRLSNDLRVDLKKELLCLYYQPQVDAESGDVKGLEALIRWPHAELGMIPPPQLIEVAEECGLILPVGDWVLRQACKDLAKLKSNGILDLTMSINVSAIQLMSGGFELQVIQALKDYGINGPELMLEITETTLIQNIDEISNVMNTLKDKGVRFSLDDFGTGYSSLASLQALNIDELKIDKSFIDRVSEDENGRAIVRALLAMTHQLHIGTVAEGVEKEEQKLFLIEQECELLQGYLFSRPLPFAELVLYLQSKK